MLEFCHLLIRNVYSRVEGNADVRIMLLVGEIMPKVFRGEASMLEHFRTSGLLDEYYATGFGTQQSGMWLSAMVKQYVLFGAIPLLFHKLSRRKTVSAFETRF